MNRFIEAKIPLEIEIDSLMQMLDADKVESQVRLSFQ